MLMACEYDTRRNQRIVADMNSTCAIEHASMAYKAIPSDTNLPLAICPIHAAAMQCHVGLDNRALTEAEALQTDHLHVRAYGCAEFSCFS